MSGTMQINLAHSRSGTPEPEVVIVASKGTHFREVKAKLLRLAAEVELATPPKEGWVVAVELSSDVRGRVYLELAHGTVEETERAMALLRKVFE